VNWSVLSFFDVNSLILDTGEIEIKQIPYSEGGHLNKFPKLANQCVSKTEWSDSIGYIVECT
jgi:hypothetical protein